MPVFDAVVIVSVLIALWGGFTGYTPADFDHFEVDHHDDKAGELKWNQN